MWNVKQYANCQTCGLWKRLAKKLTWWGWKIMRSTFWGHIWSQPNCSKTYNMYILSFLITIHGLKIDFIMSQPHHVKFFFTNLMYSPVVWLFDIFHLANVFSECIIHFQLQTWLQVSTIYMVVTVGVSRLIHRSPSRPSHRTGQL